MLLYDPVELFVIEGFLVPSSQNCGDYSCPILRELFFYLARFIEKPRVKRNSLFPFFGFPG